MKLQITHEYRHFSRSCSYFDCGKNNTGKTSVINLIRKVLNEEKTLSIDDYPLECRSRLYDVIEKYWAGEIDQSEVKQQIAETSISFYIDYSEEDDDQPLGSLSPFIIDIDDNNTTPGLMQFIPLMN